MLNNVVLMGRLTRDAELRSTTSGKSVTQFTVAVESGYGENKKANFIPCVAWGNTAEFVCKYFGKGKMIAIVGRIETRSWEGQDGKKNWVTEVIAERVEFGESKSQEKPQEIVQPTYDDEDDDLPF